MPPGDIEELPRSDSLRIFRVQRFNRDDGEGLRTVVFLSGCSLDCAWCQNPESKDRTVGYNITPADLLAEVKRDQAYFDVSGGGITLSGGEPLLQAEKTAEFLRLCQEAGIHTLVETAGQVSWKSFKAVLPYTDEFFFDIKAAGDALHQQLTRVKPDLIHENMKSLLNVARDKVTFRMVIVPGLNDQCLEEVAALLKSFGVASITLLKYHSMGEAKLAQLKTKQKPLHISDEAATQAIIEAEKLFQKQGVEVIRYDNEPPQERIQFSDRIMRLKEAVREAPFSMCIERSELFTDYIRRAPKEQDIEMTRAEALAHVMKNRAVQIYPDELLVGNYTKKRVGGNLYMEYHGPLAFILEMFGLDKRKINPLQISTREKLTFYFKLLPYWLFKNSIVKSYTFWQLLKFLYEQFFGKTYVTPLVASVAHFVPNFKKLIEKGTDGIIEEAKQHEGPFYLGIQIACDGLAQMSENYAEQARKLAEKEQDPTRRKELEWIAETCERVPRYPARTFREALQSILFGIIGLTLEVQEQGLSLGRTDQILYPYYKKDLEEGRITPEEAQEFIGCLTVKMSELNLAGPEVATQLYGGMMSGQGADFGGVDSEGKDATNDLTYMFLNAAGLGMRQPNYHARISPSESSTEYITRVCKMLCSGSPTPSLFNDDVAVPLLMQAHKVPIEEARDYSIVGCMELALSGNHFADTDWALINVVKPLEDMIRISWVQQYQSYLSMLLVALTLGSFMWSSLMATLFLATGIGIGFAIRNLFKPLSMQDVIDRYKADLQRQIDGVVEMVQPLERGLANYPTLLSDALIEGCMESGKDVNSGGAIHNSSGVQAVGVADVANSLAAIDHLVFKKGICTWEELQRAVSCNFKGYETLREQCIHVPKFGNDHSLPDQYATVAMQSFSEGLAKHKNTRGGPYLPGYYSMTTHVVYGQRTGALPSGHLAGEPLANGLSPALGTELHGPTAALNSIATQTPGANGTATNIKFHGVLLRGEKGIKIMEGLVRGFFNKGGLQLQTNVLDPVILQDAYNHPGKYPDLLVRVSGYCAYFDSLTPEMKQAIIRRTLHQQGFPQEVKAFGESATAIYVSACVM